MSRLFTPEDFGLTEASSRVLTISTLLGMDHVGSDLRLADLPSEVPQEIPFEEAIAFLKGRVSITKKQWKELGQKLQFRAFTIAKLATYQAIDNVRQGLLSALENGDGLAAFWDKLEAKEAASPYYWETVYRTNIQTVYNAGRRIQIDKIKPDALQLVVIEDSRTTAICSPLVGLTLPYNHPFWASNWPPFHFNCRTTVRAIFKESGELKGLQYPTLKEVQKTFKPQPGFGSNPVDNGNFWMMLPEMFNQGLQTGAITQMNFMDNVVADFDQVWKGYTRELKTKDGWVDVADSAKPLPEFGENFDVAKRLAADGMKVKLLPIHQGQGWKNPDYLIDGKLWELETPAALTGEAMSRAVRQGQKQAENVVIHLTGEMDVRTFRHAVWLRLTRKDSPSPLKELMVLAGNTLDRVSADFIRSHWK